MINAYYDDAYKLATKEYRRCITKGNYPYLPVLDHIIPEERVASGIEIGFVNVPADLIVGTKTAGRTRSFAANFMPLLKKDTEFAAKWGNLCEAHLKEGIRDAVKVYEYMNRYYVEEGNKRVSVLKYFGAVTIPAKVIRIMPVVVDDEAVERYMELLEFQKASGLYFVEFSKTGRYEELLSILGKTKQDKWTEEEQRSFSSVYYHFKDIYKKSIEKRFETTTADALLAYVKVYGYDTLKNTGANEIKKNLLKMAGEIILMKEEEPIQLNLQPEKSNTNLISQMMNKTTPSVKKIAFIHEKTMDTSGWTYNHELGRTHIEEVFGNKIETSVYFDAMNQGAEDVIRQAIEEGNKVIFTTSPRLLQASLHAAIENPKVTILNCSLNKSQRSVRSYYSRIYEAKFIAGAIAASMSKSGRLGYICTYPIYGQIAGINAYALGAQMVNPDAMVYLEWAEPEDLKHAVRKLVRQGIHYISSVETMPRHEENHKYFGLLKATKDDITCLAVPLWDWGNYYEEIIRQILDGSYQQLQEENNKAVNYYWGMSSGVIDIICSANMPKSSVKLASFLRESIKSGHGNPFMGPFYAQDGREVEPIDGQLSMEDIISMDYLVDNVIGFMPSYMELSPVVKATTDIMGITSVAKQAVDKDAAEAAVPGKERKKALVGVVQQTIQLEKMEVEDADEADSADGVDSPDGADGETRDME